jgi:hypothetical protein
MGQKRVGGHIGENVTAETPCMWRVTVSPSHRMECYNMGSLDKGVTIRKIMEVKTIMQNANTNEIFFYFPSFLLKYVHSKVL